VRRMLVGTVGVMVTMLWVTAGAGANGEADTWPQWRGPARDGLVAGAAWPARLGGAIAERWAVPLAPGYSGPIVSSDTVYVTETRDRTTEVVRALDRATGRERWRAEWPGAISVPFFAKSRGDWIRATPALHDDTLYVAGMRDVLVALDARTGAERWRVDFARQFSTPVPDFGFVSSPLVDGGAVYVQAGNGVAKVDARTGAVRWRTLGGGPTMFESGAFSSPVIATIAGVRQLVVQGRETLNGVALEDGVVLWSQPVPSFRGMNILTPVVVDDTIFTSTYQNGSWLYEVSRGPSGWTVRERWSMNAQGYMSTPVVIDGHVYLHLANQRFACIDLRTGERKWTTTPFGKYWSLVAQGDRILALDETGVLRLIRASPAGFELLDEVAAGEGEAWAHLAVAGQDLYVRDGRGLTAYRVAGAPQTRR
jgi:outer membrane protein assembly factor BamB